MERCLYFKLYRFIIVSSLGVVTTASCVPAIGLSLHCYFAQLSHSVFSTDLCVCATVDRLLSVPGRTVFLSMSPLSLVSMFSLKNNSYHTPDRQFGMCVAFQIFCLGFPILRLVVVSREQFRVYGSSEVQRCFYQLSCKG
ncbi:hypothetical protein T01_12622 [Trichinella spiralis]|uniref:Uncharacterized protein n=1 Tax=Trichinella spiralis TaxID=6334 RepID=A0A0V1AR63_TRISP|nr:hypothetical protein T01_12622 [Trichinella spiralis]